MEPHSIKIRTTVFKSERRRPVTALYEGDNRTYLGSVRKYGETIVVPISAVVKSEAFRRYILEVSIRFFLNNKLRGEIKKKKMQIRIHAFENNVIRSWSSRGSYVFFSCFCVLMSFIFLCKGVVTSGLIDLSIIPPYFIVIFV